MFTCQEMDRYLDQSYYEPESHNPVFASSAELESAHNQTQRWLENVAGMFEEQDFHDAQNRERRALEAAQGEHRKLQRSRRLQNREFSEDEAAEDEMDSDDGEEWLEDTMLHSEMS